MAARLERLWRRLPGREADVPRMAERIAAGDARPRDIYRLARAAGAIGYCDACGRPLLRVHILSEVLATSYGVDAGRRRGVEQAVVAAGFERGDPESPNFCSYHGQITPTSNQ